MTPDHDPDPAIPTAPRRSYPATVDLGSLLMWCKANMPPRWSLDITLSHIEDDISLVNPFGDWVDVRPEGMNRAEEVIECVNYARRACGLPEAVYLEPGEATK